MLFVSWGVELISLRGRAFSHLTMLQLTEIFSFLLGNLLFYYGPITLNYRPDLVKLHGHCQVYTKLWFKLLLKDVRSWKRRLFTSSFCKQLCKCIFLARRIISSTPQETKSIFSEQGRRNPIIFLSSSLNILETLWFHYDRVKFKPLRTKSVVFGFF